MVFDGLVPGVRREFREFSLHSLLEGCLGDALQSVRDVGHHRLCLPVEETLGKLHELDFVASGLFLGPSPDSTSIMEEPTKKGLGLTSWPEIAGLTARSESPQTRILVITTVNSLH